MKRFLSLFLCVIMSFTLLTACTDDGGKDEGGNDSAFEIHRVVDGQTSSINSIDIYLNGSTKIFAVPKNTTQTGKYYSEGSVTWASSDASVVKVSSSAGAKYRCELIGLKLGTATVTATDKNGDVNSVSVTVKSAAITPNFTDDMIIFIDDGEQTINLSDKFTVTDNLTLTATSSDTNVVSANGSSITAKQSGTATITVKNSDAKIERQFNVVVYDKPIIVASKEVVLAKNSTVTETIDLNVISKYETLNYQTTNQNVATCSNGVVTATGIGECVIKVKGGEDTVEVKVTVVEEKMKTLAVTSNMNEDYFNFYGRNWYNASKQSVMFAYGTAGFEISFYGTELKAQMTAIINSTYKPRMQVLLDGEKVYSDANARIIEINDANKKEYTIVSGLEEGWHTVKVLKRTAALRGATCMDVAGLVSVSTDGYLIAADDEPELKIEVYGDSITCGYGNLTDGKTMTSDNTNGLLTYYYQAAQSLGAQVNAMGHSGWGVYVGTGADTNIPQWYKNYTKTAYGFNYDEWDFSKYVPDVIVFNLGTNDASGVGSVYESDDFVKYYKQMIDGVWAKSPNAYIILSYGMMGANATVSEDIQRVVNEYKTANANAKISYLQFTNKSVSGHPTYSAHIYNGNELAAKIRSVLGL